MGSCFSTGNTSGAADASPPTAKIITVSGELREHCTPVAAADVLGTDHVSASASAACFLCSSDRLFCDEYIPALEPEELLQPGQIYFVLPAAKLRYPLSAEDMAALAVKASSALGLVPPGRGGGGRGRRNKSKLVRVMPVPDDSTMEGVVDGGGGEKRPRGDHKVGGRRPPPPLARAVAQGKTMKRTASIKARVAGRFIYKFSRSSRLSSIPELAEELFTREDSNRRQT